jgi:hypothetical protein
MHPSILAKRKAGAINRIVTAAGALADQHKLNPARRAALEPKGIKDLAAVEMMRLEGLAALLEDLAAVDVEAVADDETVTAVTPEPADDPRPTLEDFPAHVVESSEPEPVEEELFEEEPKKPARRPTAKHAKK